jgi:hypothetical protein
MYIAAAMRQRLKEQAHCVCVRISLKRDDDGIDEGHSGRCVA